MRMDIEDRLLKFREDCDAVLDAARQADSEGRVDAAEIIYLKLRIAELKAQLASIEKEFYR